MGAQEVTLGTSSNVDLSGSAGRAWKSLTNETAVPTGATYNTSAGAGGGTSTTHFFNTEQYKYLPHTYCWIASSGSTWEVVSNAIGGANVESTGWAAGGTLMIECNWAFDFDAGATIESKWGNGTSWQWSGSRKAWGWWGGSGWFVFVIYKTLTANAWTYTLTWGTGGVSDGVGNSWWGWWGSNPEHSGTTWTEAADTVKSWGDGATGHSLAIENTDLS